MKDLNQQYHVQGDLTNNGIFNQDNSININNYNCRINLINRDNGKEYEYDLFCICKYKNSKNNTRDHIRVTCINIHSSNMFVSDHVHMEFPEKMYDNYYEHSIMKVKAKVYKYIRANGTEDFGLVVTKIISCNNRIGLYGNQFGLNNKPNESNDVYEYMKYMVFNTFTHGGLVEILSEQIGYIEGKISVANQLYSGFISDMILTYYFANTRKEDLENKLPFFYNLNDDVLFDLIKMLSKLMYKLNTGEIFMWRQFIQEVNLLCNVFQGIEIPMSNVNKKIKTDKVVKLNNNIKLFATRIDVVDVKKMFGKIRLRNKDFEFEYPEDIQKFNDELDSYVVWYFMNKGYVKSEDYMDDWKELYEI